MMKVELGRQVIVTNPFVVSFLSNNVNNAVILKSCDSVLETYCRMTQDLIERHAEHDQRSQEMNEVMSYMTQYNEGIQLAYTTQLKKIEGIVTETGEGICERLDDIDDVLQTNKMELGEKLANSTSSLTTLIANMTQTIGKTLGVDGWSDTIVDKVCKHLVLQFGNATNCIMKEVKECMKVALDPIDIQHRDIFERLCKLPDDLKQGDVGMRIGEIKMSLQCYEAKSSKQVEELHQKLQEMLAKHVDFKEHLHQLPLVTKGLLSDMLRDADKKTRDVSNMLTSTHQRIIALEAGVKDAEVRHITSMNRAHHEAETMSGKLDSINTQLIKNTYNSKAKGSVSESRMSDLLETRLYKRDGYTIEKVTGQARTCDIVVKREKYASIRIECKAHGLGTEEKVRYSEVEKFQRDLMQVNNHGLFVSIYSGINGVGNFEIQQLANGKFAMYLTKNNYDIDMIIECIRLIYKLDEITISSSGADNVGEGHICISLESMGRIQSYLKDYIVKINSIKTHMKESLTLVSEIQLDMIEKILVGNQPVKSPIVNRVTCEWCQKEYTTEKGCANHKRTCSQAPSSSKTKP